MTVDSSKATSWYIYIYTPGLCSPDSFAPFVMFASQGSCHYYVQRYGVVPFLRWHSILWSAPISSRFGYVCQTMAAASALVMSPASDLRCCNVFFKSSAARAPDLACPEDFSFSLRILLLFPRLCGYRQEDLDTASVVLSVWNERVDN